MSDADEELLRKIYFYRVPHWSDIQPHLPSDIQRIANLPWAEPGRYLPETDGSRLALWPDSTSYPIRLRFGRTRLGNLPLKEQSGKLEHLGLAINEGLVELCHVVIYPNGYAAAEFNYAGPRIKRLSDYLYSKHNELKDRVQFWPLLQRDIISLVAEMPTITVVELVGQPSSASLLRQADQGLSDAMKTLGQVGADKSIRLALTSDHSGDSKLHRLSNRLAQMISKHLLPARDQLRTLRVKGYNNLGKVDIIDLLEQHLVVFKAIERDSPDSKAVSSEAAYAQIDAAYEQLKDQLDRAAAGKELFE